MNQEKLRALLERLQSGKTSVDETLQSLRALPVADMGFARVDTHRALRCGFPEVIYCPGKTPDQVLKIAEKLAAHTDRLLLTRAEPPLFLRVRRKFPKAQYHDAARAITWQKGKPAPRQGLVSVLTAGTVDIPVAEEARVTAEIMGAHVETHYDCGVAGIHRLLERTAHIQKARALVVVAGMEGALASVVGGLVDRPVIAVPTSAGYGASFGGVAPLLTMLNSCAAGVSVVNIDNGFGAGYIAALINQSAPSGKKP